MAFISVYVCVCECEYVSVSLVTSDRGQLVVNSIYSGLALVCMCCVRYYELGDFTVDYMYVRVVLVYMCVCVWMCLCLYVKHRITLFVQPLSLSLSF